MSHTMTGSLEECCKAYLQAMPDNMRRRADIYREIGGVVGAEGATVSSWMRGIAPPKGEKRFRFSMCLDSQGYRVNEIDRLEPEMLKFAEAAVASGLPMTEISDAVGVRRPGTLYRILRGEGAPSSTTLQGMKRWLSEHGPADDSQAHVAQPPRVASTVKAVQESADVGINDNSYMYGVAGLLAQLAPHLTRIRDDASPEEVAMLHRIIGVHHFVQISTDLNLINTPRSLESFRNKQ